MEVASAIASPEELTSELRQQLAYERVNFDRWCDERRAQLDGLEQKHQLNMAQAQATLQALSVNEQNIAARVEEAAQVRSKHTALLAEETTRREAIMQEHEEMTPKASAARRHVCRPPCRGMTFAPARRAQIETLHRQRAEATATLEKERARSAEATCVEQERLNDMTRGIHLFARLGLTFQCNADESLKFVFTLIDPNEHGREFYFNVKVGDDERYRLVDCYPAIAEQELEELVCDLNERNNFPSFVLAMRRAFQRMCQ